MSNILEFPSPETQAYAFLETQLRDLLSSKGADETLIRFATDTLKSVYGDIVEAGEFHFRVDLPAVTTEEEAERLQQQIGHGIDTIRREHHDMMVKLASRLVLTEMKLFQERRSDL